VAEASGAGPHRRQDDARAMAAVRWLGIRHGDDHVHLVATLVRQDGAHRVGLERLPRRAGSGPGTGGPVRAAPGRPGPVGAVTCGSITRRASLPEIDGWA